MKNIYSKYKNNLPEEHPIPEPEEQLFNNPDEENSLTFSSKVKLFAKSQKNQNSEK